MKEKKRKRSLQMSPVFRLGWRSQHNHQEIVDQSKNLCGRYIRFRLRRCSEAYSSGKKLNLQRLRSATNLLAGGNGHLSAVSIHLRGLCSELEMTHPKLFCSVVANVGLGKISPSELAVGSIFTAIADNLLGCTEEPSWGRVVALYTLSGALAMDCVKLGRSDLLLNLVDAFGSFVERELADWIAEQGGWEALLENFQSRRVQVVQLLPFLSFPVIVGMVTYFYCCT